MIANRYLRFKKSWTREVLERLADNGPVTTDADDEPVVEVADPTAAAPETGQPPESIDEPPVEIKKDAAEEALEKPLRLHEQRLNRVAEVLVEKGARRVIDLGCGSGKLLKRLLAEKQFTDVLGVDVSSLCLDLAERRLKLDRMSEKQRKRITLIQGALTYRDRRLEGFDAAALVEVIEHLEPDRLPALVRVVFEFAKPNLVVITTPNVEYNAKFEGMKPGQMRHADHRFEWTRAEFEAWAAPIAERFDYKVEFHGLGDADETLGAPSQMAVFEK
jgi:3' terminal RNA ribose 2'-O-methyltransferase Hen1